MDTRIVNLDLMEFVERNILPRYNNFDKAHNLNHANLVIKNSLALALSTGADINMAYAIAAYHDLGLSADRKTHHLVSGQMIRNDIKLKKWFTAEEIETMAQAVEDHRASSDHEPRSIYGKIVAEADRMIDLGTIVRRTVQYGIDHYPELNRAGHIQRALEHLDKKYAENGYLKLWIPESSNAERLHSLREAIKDRAKMTRLIEDCLDRELMTDKMEKAI